MLKLYTSGTNPTVTQRKGEGPEKVPEAPHPGITDKAVLSKLSPLFVTFLSTQIPKV